ncbi:hypothetical protein [uncultured Bacteroides sp.]|nr:hypothetical protein [uncultured Bacteroides sp.]
MIVTKGEQNELKNRYMVIDAPKEWISEEHSTSTRQASDKFTCYFKSD